MRKMSILLVVLLCFVSLSAPASDAPWYRC